MLTACLMMRLGQIHALLGLEFSAIIWQQLEENPHLPFSSSSQEEVDREGWMKC